MNVVTFSRTQSVDCGYKRRIYEFKYMLSSPKEVIKKLVQSELSFFFRPGRTFFIQQFYNDPKIREVF